MLFGSRSSGHQSDDDRQDDGTADFRTFIAQTRSGVNNSSRVLVLLRLIFGCCSILRAPDVLYLSRRRPCAFDVPIPALSPTYDAASEACASDLSAQPDSEVTFLTEYLSPRSSSMIQPATLSRSTIVVIARCLLEVAQEASSQPRIR